MDFDFSTETIKLDTTDVLTITATGGIVIPTGTNSQRPSSLSTGILRYNTDLGALECYTGSSWTIIGSGSPVGNNGTTSVNFGGSPGASMASVTITGQTGITTTSNISARMAYSTPSNVAVSQPNNFTGIWTGINAIITDMAYDGSGVYVAVGTTGIILRSTDGLTWSSISNPISSSVTLYQIIFGGGLFVAVGSGGTLATSPDGTNWTVQTSSFSGGDTIYSVAFNNGIFVAVGSSGKIATSNNGTSWAQQTSITTSTLLSVTNCPTSGNFMAVGRDGTFIQTTNSGVAWTPGTLTNFGTLDTLTSILYPSNGAVVCGSTSGYIGYGTSMGNISTKILVNKKNNNITDIAYGDGYYLAVGSLGSAYFSLNGIDWYATRFSNYFRPSVDFTFVKYLNGRFYTGINNYGVIARSDPVKSILHTEYEHTIIPATINISNVIAGTGFTINVTSQQRLTGVFTINWSWE